MEDICSDLHEVLVLSFVAESNCVYFTKLCYNFSTQNPKNLSVANRPTKNVCNQARFIKFQCEVYFSLLNNHSLVRSLMP